MAEPSNAGEDSQKLKAGAQQEREDEIDIKFSYFLKRIKREEQNQQQIQVVIPKYFLIPATRKDLEQGTIPLNKYFEMDLKKKYNEMIANCHKLELIKDIYSESIEPGVISPNPLTSRFERNGVRLIRTDIINSLLKHFLKEIPYSCIEGPRGIGKSHALLALVLNIRKLRGGVVIYVNNPREWAAQPFSYIINEIIYALIPFREEFNVPLGGWPNSRQAEFLFQWYYVLSYINEANDQPIDLLRLLFERLRMAVSERFYRNTNIFWINDQENDFGDQDLSKFPFILRLEFCSRIILLSSNPYSITFDGFNVVTEEEVARLVIHSLQVKDFGEEKLKLLY